MIHPTWLLDSGEEFRPCAVETLREMKARFVRADGTAALTYDFDRLPDGGHFDLPPAARMPDEAPVVVYQRIKLGSPHAAVQYWLFYPYNPGPPALHGVGRHEGDWECVTVLYSEFDVEFEKPTDVVISNHKHALKREAWRVEGWKGGELRIYVARGSHAHYFHPERGVDDVADGKGLELSPHYVKLEPVGAWAKAKVTWGASDNSPEALATREAWNSPLRAKGKAKDS